jgi:hypothetical protein
MESYSGEQLPIVGFDDVSLEVESGLSSACSSTYSLPPNEWHQIALPCDPGENKSVTAVFGDDNLGSYGTHWVIFRYDSVNSRYDEMDESGTLNQGEGYWITHINEGSKTLTMPSDSAETPISYPTGCNNDEGCFKIPLVARSSPVTWNMVGHPFETSHLASSVVITGEEVCGSEGCNLDEALTAGILHNALWTYRYDNGVGAYAKVSTVGSNPLNPWKGYWAAALGNAAANAPINLLIQK